MECLADRSTGERSYLSSFTPGDGSALPRAEIEKRLREIYPSEWSKPDILDSRFYDIAIRASNITSQFGEDGLLAAIFEKIGVKHQTCFEVGATDGEFFSNTKALRDKGWSAVLVESNSVDYQELTRFASDKVRTIHETIGPDSPIDWCMGRVHQDFDLGVIDIDGGDVDAWLAMKSLRPRVMVVECDDRDKRENSSELLALAVEKNYTAVAKTRCNMIFVANEAIPDILGDPQIESSPIKIAAIMSIPRVGWNDGWGCIQEALRPFGIPVRRANGVYWGQCMQKMLVQALADGVDWILTIDYDSMFRAEHVDSLLAVLGRNPLVDAVAALQNRRASEFPLLGLKGVADRTMEIDGSPIKVDSAHFGLTLIRAEPLKTLPKPWFLSRPDADGDWGDGRIDDDIYFWQNWREHGRTIYIDPNCRIGHLQLMVSEFDENMKARHIHVRDWWKRGKENHAGRNET